MAGHESGIEIAGAGTFDEAHHELFKVTPEINAFHLALTLITIFIVVFGMFSALVKERIYAGEAIIATLFGIIFNLAGQISPRDWASQRSWDTLTLELSRVVIALSVFAVGVELPKAYILKHWKSLIILLGPLMIIGWMITGLIIWGMIPDLNFLHALVVAACATPTDPILAASVVGSGKFAQKHVPSHIRHILQAESGSNDGAAFPFLYLALFLIMRGDTSVGKAVGQWIYLVILYQIVLGVVIGAITGIIARKVMKFAKRRSLIDRESMVAMYVALALFVTGVTTLAGSDDLLAAFACGTAFAWDDWFSESIEHSNFSNIIDLLVNCTTFIYIGATIPFGTFNDADLSLNPWRLAVVAILVFLFRRLPSVLAMYHFIPDVKTFREAMFVGHFGPIGVGAIFISTLAVEKLPTPNIPPQNAEDTLALSIQPIVYFLVLGSIIVHGLSIPIFTTGKRVHSISRTWTRGSEAGEPGWLSRVKRMGDPENVVINRDEDDLERGTTGDIGDSKINSVDYAHRRRSNGPEDDNEDCDDQVHDPSRSPSVQHSDEGPSDDTRIGDDRHGKQVWREGDEDVIETEDGERVRVVPHEKKVHEVATNMKANGSTESVSSLKQQLRREKAAIERVVHSLLHRRGSKQSLEEGHDGTPSPSPRPAPNRRMSAAEKFERDKWCRLERIDKGGKEEKIWKQGRHIVIERKDGEEVECYAADPEEEKAIKANRTPGWGTLLAIPKAKITEEKRKMAQEEEAQKRGRTRTVSSNTGGPPQAGPSNSAASMPSPVEEEQEGTTPVDEDSPTDLRRPSLFAAGRESLMRIVNPARSVSPPEMAQRDNRLLTLNDELSRPSSIRFASPPSSRRESPNRARKRSK